MADGETSTRLAALPHDHPARNLPLIEIGAQCRWIGAKPGKGWRPVGKTWRIARRSFNDLGSAWTTWDEWRATRSPREATAP